MTKQVHILRVFLHDCEIGTLTHLPDERSVFAFHSDYIQNAQRPTLSLSFKDAFGTLIANPNPERVKLPPFFSNLLPEGPLRDYLAKQSGVNPVREFFLLWALGADLPGAVRVSSDRDDVWPKHENENSSNADSHAFHFSLAGVQLKFSAIERARGGLTIPTHGVGGDWIVKLPSTHFKHVPENEFSMMTLAKQIGMDVPDIALIPIDRIQGLPQFPKTVTEPAFAIRRFDRDSHGKAVHMEDFAQVFGVYPDDKYKRASYRNIAAVLWAEGDEADIAELTRRLVFNTLIGNADMHLKNVSLLYRDGHNATLAPAYDFVSTIAYLDDTEMALRYSQTKRMQDLSLAELAHLANRARLPEQVILGSAQETVARFMELWAHEKTHLPLTQEMVAAIDRHLQKIPLVTAL